MSAFPLFGALVVCFLGRNTSKIKFIGWLDASFFSKTEFQRHGCFPILRKAFKPSIACTMDGTVRQDDNSKGCCILRYVNWNPN